MRKSAKAATETTMTREDTGEFLPVRVAEQPDIEPPASQTPIFDSMADHPGAGDEWRRQAGLSRARFDGMGIGNVEPEPEPVQWAELPDEGHGPASYYEVARRMSSDPQVRAAIDRAEQDEPDPVAAYMAAGDPDRRPGRWVNVAEDDLLPARMVRVGDTNLPRRNDTFERRFVPDPAGYGPHPADHGPVDRWLERTEQRLRAWWAGKQAQRDERMGVEQ